MSEQQGLFDWPAPAVLPPLKITVRRDRKARDEGKALAEQGMQRAIDKADADTDDAFSKAALAFFITYAMRAHPAAVGVAEARLASKGIVPAIKNARSWGQIPIKAKAQGFVTFAGHGASTDPKSHSTPRGLWLWTGKVR